MDKFKKIVSVAAPLPLINVDTDMIIPKQFLKTIRRTGLGIHAFSDMRYDNVGNEIDEFVLNKSEYRKSRIIIAGDNFGCGSSREHAPWALLDFGIRVIISTGFADIFYNNCFKNGILPVILQRNLRDQLMEDAESVTSSKLTIDLEKQNIVRTNGKIIEFEIEKFRKKCLLEGLDDIALTLQVSDKINEFEAANRELFPWL